MEFQEAAVHYAFPIVGVIVCCLLVFAFGFKSPGQPPSFDIVDVERKVVKKRKGKENQKVKPQQNGKVTSAVPAKVEATPHTPKTKAAAEKQVNKSEAKQSNKKSRSQQAAKQVDVKNKSEVVQSEDGNEDGWVQQVSKKERKNRKKDDVPSSTDVPKTAAEVEASLQVSEIPEKAGSLKEQVIQVEKEKEKQNDSSDSAVEKEPIEDTNKSTPKAQRTPKKKKGKKDEEVGVESSARKEPLIPEIPIPKQKGINSESKSYSSVTSSNAVIEPPSDDLLQVQETADVSEEEVKSKSKKKKSKKKSQETTEIEDMKTETKIVHAQVEHNEVVEQQTVPKKEIIIEPKLIEVELQDDGKKDMSNEPSSTPGSNVAFDELKDLCPEEKPQKKKKKVRREH